jgi:hypothetical protein
VVAAVSVAAAGLAFLLDVGDFAAGRYFAVAADHAPTAEGGETEQSNETHRALLISAEQYTCRVIIDNEPHLADWLVYISAQRAIAHSTNIASNRI